MSKCRPYVFPSSTQLTINHVYLFLLVAYLADLYVEGEKTYEIEEDGKFTTVSVDRTLYVLSPEAMHHFTEIHNDWEMKVCKEHPYDPFVGGKF